MTFRFTLWPLNRLWPHRRWTWTWSWPISGASEIAELWSDFPAGEEEPSTSGRDMTRTWDWRRFKYTTVVHWPPSSDAPWEIQTRTWSGDATINANLLLRGVITGDVAVVAGSKLQVDGAVLGDVHLAAGSSVDINGYVGGNVVVGDGRLTVRGVVAGRIRGDDGFVVIEPGASISHRDHA